MAAFQKQVLLTPCFVHSRKKIVCIEYASIYDFHASKTPWQPWDEHIYLPLVKFCMLDKCIGKFTSPMDGGGKARHQVNVPVILMKSLSV